MYTRIVSPYIDIYNASSGNLLGTATLDLTPFEEKKLLDFLNQGKPFSDLLVLNANLYNASKEYTAPTVGNPMDREGTFHALFRDEAGVYVPMEIRMKFLARARGAVKGDPYYLSSVQYSDIVVESVERLV